MLDFPPRWRIALLEPDVDLAESLRELLEDGGYLVDVVHGWDALRELSLDEVALALVDVGPGKEGVELLEQAGAQGALDGVPLVGLVSSAPVSHPRLSASLRKPFEVAELLETIRRHAR